jgi:NADH-quinone oxidoreductase subunit F
MPEIDSFAAFDKVLEKTKAKVDPARPCITVCGGTGCHAYGCMKVIDAVKSELSEKGLTDKIQLRATGCHGFCERGSLMVLHPSDIFYQQVQVEDVPEIIEKTVLNGEVIDRLLWTDPQSGDKVKLETDVPFYSNQTRTIFGQNKLLSPSSIEDYLALDGYSALRRALDTMKPEQVIEEVEKSGLRGRGGGGFPTGSKWRHCAKQPGDVKYLVCNADEGDPGAYMDRSLLEGNPHSVIEGMLIGAYAIGANRGYIYVRHEYPFAVENTLVALDQSREAGLLGDNIMGSGFSFDVEICRGAGAFVCGEETGLIAAIEGKVSEPKDRPPYPVERGLWRDPTVINNVETWANVPLIINKGADWYNGVGTEGSKGTKIFSLVGKVNNTGLVEVPMGITLREIVFDIGGGVRDNKKFKAVQTGGPSGGCLPEEKLDLKVDFDELTRAGSMMGSGGMVVMDEDTCMVDVARYFLTFLQDESCGSCVPCRLGIERMLEIVTDITEGRAIEEQIELLEDVADTVAISSMCGLGRTAPNPVLSTLKYFRSEYEAHVRDKRCPAGVCRALITYSIDPEKCNGCTLCFKACPAGAISGEKKQVHVIDEAKCNRCGICRDICNQDAVIVE